MVLPSMQRLCALLFIILLACQDGPVAPDYGAATGNAASFGLWAPGALFAVRCDVLTKLHQGTHSKDAFTNNLHELVYHIRCSDGTEMHITMLAAIGTPGQFTRSCDGAAIAVGPATPANSPDGGEIGRAHV